MTNMQEELNRLVSNLDVTSKQINEMSNYVLRVKTVVQKSIDTLAAIPQLPEGVDIGNVIAINSLMAAQTRRLADAMHMSENTPVEEVFNHATQLLGGMYDQLGQPAESTYPEAEVLDPIQMPTVADDVENQQEKVAAIMKDWQLGILRTYLSPSTWPNGTGLVRQKKGVLEKYNEDILKVDFETLFKWPVGFYVSSENGVTQLMLRKGDIAIIIPDTTDIGSVPMVYVRITPINGMVSYGATRLDEAAHDVYEAAHTIAKQVLFELNSAM